MDISSNDNTVLDSNEQANGTTTGLMEFAVEETQGQTRTMGIYDGSHIKFYWTEGDKLWINTDGTTLVQSAKDEINSAMTALKDTKTPDAKFYFSGLYTAESYPVRYTGNGNAHGDKVTIKSEQSQTEPNNARHLGTDGDCGTATAVRENGKYKFTLSHKAAYMTFTPYYSYGFADDVKVTKIKITADEALAGEFGFNDNGIDVSKRPAADASNCSVTLNLGNFAIPTQAEISKNAAILVLAPGTYHNFKVEYFLNDSKTNVYGSVVKNYGTLTFTPGKNRRVSANLAVTHYGQDIFYMWDATVGQHAWKGHEGNQPSFNELIDNAYPKAGDPRYYNGVYHPASASRSAKDCPNANELYWYAKEGDPHWDASIWCFMKHLYQGGMWLKKLDVIARKTGKSLETIKKEGPNRIDFTKSSSDVKIYDKYKHVNKNVTLGKPSNLSDYLFFPAIGDYIIANTTDGKLVNVGIKGYYWSSTPRPDGNLNAYNFCVERDKVHTGYGGKMNSHCLWPK